MIPRPGTRMKVIQGYHQTDRHAWMETGDVVTVKGVYPHVILVERPYRDRKRGMMRECFCISDLYKHLKVMT